MERQAVTVVEPLAQQGDDVSWREKHLFAAKLALELNGVSILDDIGHLLPLTSSHILDKWTSSSH